VELISAGNILCLPFASVVDKIEMHVQQTVIISERIIAHKHAFLKVMLCLNSL